MRKDKKRYVSVHAVQGKRQKEEEISTQVHLLHKYIGEHIDGQKTVISQKLAVSGLLTTAPILKVPFKDEKISGDVFNLA